MEEDGDLAASEVEGARVVGDDGEIAVNWGGGGDELEVLAGAAVDFGAVVGHVRRDDDLHGRCGVGKARVEEAGGIDMTFALRARDEDVVLWLGRHVIACIAQLASSF